MSGLFPVQQRGAAGPASYGDSLLIQCEPVNMELTYITERIIALTYSDNGDENAYSDSVIEVAEMLKNKHGSRFKVVNLSESRHELLSSCGASGQVLECGWPPRLAPPLERLCTICRDIDDWLHGGGVAAVAGGGERTVVVLHCRGGLDRMAVVLAAYINYSNVVAKQQQPFDRLAMKQFFDQQLARILEPSEIRYIRYFSGLLMGTLQVSSAPVYLQHIVIHGVPQFGSAEAGEARGGLQPFVRIYQNMEPMYTSNVYSVTATQPRVCISLRRPLELSGDILVKCYHRTLHGRESVFRLQFNTSTIVGDRLLASKMELDDAIEDQRFSDRSRVELIFVNPGAAGQQHQDVSLSWESSDDPIVKWDSYERLVPLGEEQVRVKSRKAIVDVVSDRNLVRVSRYFEEGPLEDSMFAKTQKRLQADDGELFAELVFKGNGTVHGPSNGGAVFSGAASSTSLSSSAQRASGASSGQSTGLPSPYSSVASTEGLGATLQYRQAGDSLGASAAAVPVGGVTGLVRGVQASPTVSPALSTQRQQQQQQGYTADARLLNGAQVLPSTPASTTGAATQWSMESKEQRELDEILNELLGDAYTPSTPLQASPATAATVRPAGDSVTVAPPVSPYSIGASLPSAQVGPGSSNAAGGAYLYTRPQYGVAGTSSAAAVAAGVSSSVRWEDKQPPPTSSSERSTLSGAYGNQVPAASGSGGNTGSSPLTPSSWPPPQQQPSSSRLGASAPLQSSPRVGGGGSAAWSGADEQQQQEQQQIVAGDGPASLPQLSPAGGQQQTPSPAAALDGAGASWLEQQQRKLLARNKSRSEDEHVRKQQQERQLVSELRQAQERKRNLSMSSEGGCVSSGGAAIADDGGAKTPDSASRLPSWQQSDVVSSSGGSSSSVGSPTTRVFAGQRTASSVEHVTLQQQQQRLQETHIQAGSSMEAPTYSEPQQNRRILELEEMLRMMDERQRMQERQVAGVGRSPAAAAPATGPATTAVGASSFQSVSYGGSGTSYSVSSSQAAAAGTEAKPPRPPRSSEPEPADDDSFAFRSLGIQSLESATLPRTSAGNVVPPASTDDDGTRQASPYFRSVSRSSSQDGGFASARREIAVGSNTYHVQQQQYRAMTPLQVNAMPPSPGMPVSVPAASPGSFSSGSGGGPFPADRQDANLSFQQQYGEQSLETAYSRQQALQADISSPYFNMGGSVSPGGAPSRNNSAMSNGLHSSIGLQQTREGVQFQGTLNRNGHWGGGNGGPAALRSVDGGFAFGSPAAQQQLQQVPPSPPAEGSFGVSRQQTLRFNTLGQASYGNSLQHSPDGNADGQPSPPDTGYVTAKFVRDTSRYWYKPSISREEAINMLKDAAPGAFVVRDSNSFPGAFGLALRVAQLPAGVVAKGSAGGGDLSSEYVRFFLIEPTAKGVRLKGCSNEPAFGSLAALIYQHTITQLALPCKLILPDPDKIRLAVDVSPVVEPVEVGGTESAPSAEAAAPSSSAADLLNRGAACSVIYLNSVDTESLTGPQAVSRAVQQTFASSRTNCTIVNFKVSAEGITITDMNRKLFFRQHFPRETISFCGSDPAGRTFTEVLDNGISVKDAAVFGFVAKRNGNQCLLFAEMDPDQPATAIVNFIMKVMMPAK